MIHVGTGVATTDTLGGGKVVLSSSPSVWLCSRLTAGGMLLASFALPEDSAFEEPEFAPYPSLRFAPQSG